MKNIQLFHSYNYVYENFTHSNKNMYDKNNKLIFSLLNIPDTSDLYTIEIQRILKKKTFSKKTNTKSFYTKHNIKVFLLVNYNKLHYYIKHDIPIPQFNILYKIILNNLKISKNEYIHNIICINKSYNKKIGMKNIISNDFNFFNLNEYYLDILNEKIIDKKNLKLTTYIVNGCIVYYDLLKILIDELLSIKNTIFIGNINQTIYFKNIITTIDTINRNIFYDTVILLDTSIDISCIKYNKIIVCVNKTTNIKVNNILFLLNKYFRINLYNYELTNKLIYNIINGCVFRNYSQKLIKVNNINICENEYINFKHFKIVDNEILNKICNICVNNTINIETGCNHYFCIDCMRKLIKNTKLICPYCRFTNSISMLSYLLKSKNDILNDVNINNKYKYLLKKSMKSDISIIYNDNTKIKTLRNLYKFMNINQYIHTSYNIETIETINKNNIYFLDSQDNYDINTISNTLIKNGLKKFNFNFLC
jgi:hypothetical protein